MTITLKKRAMTIERCLTPIIAVLGIILILVIVSWIPSPPTYSVVGKVEQKKLKIEKNWFGSDSSFYITVQNIDYEISKYSFNQVKKKSWVELGVNKEGVQTVLYEEIPN